MFDDTQVKEIATRLHRKPSQVLLKWALQQNIGKKIPSCSQKRGACVSHYPFFIFNMWCYMIFSSVHICPYACAVISEHIFASAANYYTLFHAINKSRNWLMNA